MPAKTGSGGAGPRATSAATTKPAPAAARIEFDGKLTPNIPAGTFIPIPEGLSAKLPGRGIIRVKGTVGGVAVESSLMPDGAGSRCLGVHKATLAEGGLEHGQTVHVAIEVDAAPRIVEVPPDLARALKRVPGARKIFDALAHTHRREYLAWIEEAKKPETRERRVAKAVAMIGEGKKL